MRLVDWLIPIAVLVIGAWYIAQMMIEDIAILKGL